jgi:hypothetical protein
MVRSIVIRLCVVVVFLVSVSQALDLGIRGGLAFSSLHGDGVADCGWRQGMCVGVSTEYSILGLVAIQPELLYIQKGAKCDVNPFTGTDIGETYVVKLDYVELPVLAAMSVPLPSLVKPKVFAGPYIAYNLKAQGSFETGSSTDLDFIKAFDYGAVVGVGTDLDFLVAKVMLDGRYTFSLASIHEDGDDVKNRSITVVLGLLLNF